MPQSASHTFADPYPYQTAIRAAEVEVLVTARGEFRADLTKIDLPRLWMQRGNENLPRISYAANSRRRAPIFFLARADQPALHHSGMELSPGEIMVYSSAAAHHHWSRAPVHWGAMSLTPDDLSTVGRALTDRDLFVPAVTHLVRPSPPLMSRLVDLHETAGQLAKTAPEILAHTEVARALEHALLHAMIACLTERSPIQMTAGGRHHLLIVSRLEELLAVNSDRPVYLAEICAAVGASERTLRAICQEHLGIGPVRYLWLRRMHLARRALVLATPETGSVTEIALNHGFWELGRFSVAYRRLFGELPSASLRRPPIDLRQFRDGPFALPDSESA